MVRGLQKLRSEDEERACSSVVGIFGRDRSAFSPGVGVAASCLVRVLRAYTAAIVLPGMTMLPLDATGAVMGRRAGAVFVGRLSSQAKLLGCRWLNWSIFWWLR